MPLDSVRHQLGFESESECARFLRAHGIESEDGVIFLERGTFLLPDTEPPTLRNPGLIDSKRTACYGEVMNGAPLPENPFLTYTPHSSFDEEGVLRREAWEAQDQEATVSPEELERSRREEERRALEKEVAREAMEEVVSEIVIEETKEVAGEVVGEAERMEVAEAVRERVEESCVAGMVEEVAATCLREARNSLIAAKMEEEERREEQEEACVELVAGMVGELVEELAGQEMAEVGRRRELQRHLAVAEPVLEGVLSETLAPLVSDVARDVLEAAVQGRGAALEQLGARMTARQLRRCFTEWRRQASRSSRQRAAVRDFPAGPAALTDEEQNSRLGWGREGREGRRDSLGGILEGRRNLETLLAAVELQDR